jgi:MFS family permease
MVAAVGGKKRTGGAFGGYGGAKGLGYLLGPLLGGGLVALGGYPLLFAMLAGLAALVAVLALRAVPHVAPTTRTRSTLAELGRQLTGRGFVRPVIMLAAGTAALSAGVGYLPVLGTRHHFGPLATGALVSLLAATAALLQPWAGQARDGDKLPEGAGPAALAVAAAGFGVAVLFPVTAGIALAAVLIGAGVAVSTPLGFADLAAAAPPGRMGQTMGAGEVGRELGDAGGPLLVGVLSPLGLGAALAGLAGAIGVGAATAWKMGGAKPENETAFEDTD